MEGRVVSKHSVIFFFFRKDNSCEGMGGRQSLEMQHVKHLPYPKFALFADLCTCTQLSE